MKKMTAIAALSLAAILPLAAMPASAATASAQTNICDQSPQKAADAGIDCTTTATTPRHEDSADKKYPNGPVSFGSGIVF